MAWDGVGEREKCKVISLGVGSHFKDFFKTIFLQINGLFPKSWQMVIFRNMKYCISVVPVSFSAPPSSRVHIWLFTLSSDKLEFVICFIGANYDFCKLVCTNPDLPSSVLCKSEKSCANIRREERVEDLVWLVCPGLIQIIRTTICHKV